MLFGALGAILLGNMLADKGIIRVAIIFIIFSDSLMF